jgi:hypothetical protein
MHGIHSSYIALFVVFCSIIYHYWQQGTLLTNKDTMTTPKWQFAAQRGFFSHDDDPESWEFRATTRPSLGLLERQYPSDDDFWARESRGTDQSSSQIQWRRFRHYIQSLNTEDPEHKQYKLFYIIRHGQGVHNVKETEVGREEWNVSRSSAVPRIELTTAPAPLGQTPRRRYDNMARRRAHIQRGTASRSHIVYLVQWWNTASALDLLEPSAPMLTYHETCLCTRNRNPYYQGKAQGTTRGAYVRSTKQSVLDR